MKFLRTGFHCSLVMCLALFCTQMIQAQNESEKCVKFGAVQCEEELAILDSIEFKLKNDPFTTAYFFVYGGKRDTRRNEVQLRSARMRRYLAENRGIESSRVKTIAAGFREKFTIEVWLVSVGEDAPKPTPTISRGNIRFKKGRLSSWEEPGCYANHSQTIRENYKSEKSGNAQWEQ